MKRPFFTKTQLSSSKSQSITPKCGQCGLYKQCKSPKMPPTGKGRKGILFLAEAPGKTEDEKNIQLIGDAGQYLRRVLQNMGYDLDCDFIKTNAAICRPPNNKTPDAKIIDACRPNLTKTLKKYQPHTIILLGDIALKSFMPMVWKDKVDKVGQWIGWNIPCQEKNMWVCPTYHPSYLLRTHNTVTEHMFRQHIRRACRHKQRPYQTQPDPKSKVMLLHRSSEIKAALRDCYWWQHLTLDYETNCLKPETENSRIVCCSVSNGRKTFAFPWTDTAIENIIRIYKNPNIKKIAANIKFEHRWTFNKLHINIRGWYYDTMVGAHVLDHRQGITSVKFQAFVRMGMPVYNEHIEPYLKPKGKSRINSIDQIDFDELLLYCGLDSYCEDKLAWLQIKEMQNQSIIN